MDKELDSRGMQLPSHIAGSVPTQDVNMQLSSNTKHVLHHPQWTETCSLTNFLLPGLRSAT